VASGYIPEAKIDTHGGGAGGSIRPNSQVRDASRRNQLAYQLHLHQEEAPFRGGAGVGGRPAAETITH
jgi:hypothetical protein